MSKKQKQHLTSVELAMRAIKEKIVSWELRPGQQVSEVELAATLKNAKGEAMSRTPVKIALVQLAAEGLVEQIPHLGTRIRTITIDELREVIRLRKHNEAFFACELAKLQHVDLAKLDVTLEQMIAIKEKTAMGLTIPKEKELRYKFVEQDLEFHTLIAELAGYEVAGVEMIRNWTTKSLISTIARKPLSENEATAVITEHGDILDAIRRKDEPQIEEKVIAHFDNTKRRWSDDM